MCSGVVKLTLSWHYINIVRHTHTHTHVCACLCMHEYLYPHLYAKLILKVNAAKLFAIRFHLALALSVASTFRLLTSSLSLPLPSFFPLHSLSPLVSDELCGLIFFLSSLWAATGFCLKQIALHLQFKFNPKLFPGSWVREGGTEKAIEATTSAWVIYVFQFSRAPLTPLTPSAPLCAT